MINEYLILLNKLEKIKPKTLHIKELNADIETIKPIQLAILLQPFISLANEDLDVPIVKPRKFDKEIIKKAFEFVKANMKNNISNVYFLGKNSENAFEIFQNKYKDYIYLDEYNKIIKKDNEIYFSIKNNIPEIYDIFSSLSELGITIIIFSNYDTHVFSFGESAEREMEEIQLFINFYYNYGLLIDEFLMGKLLYDLYFVDKKYSDIIIDNLNSNFVISLSEILGQERITFGRSNGFRKENTYLKDLITIFNSLKFNNIKDYSFNFVRKFFI